MKAGIILHAFGRLFVCIVYRCVEEIHEEEKDLKAQVNKIEFYYGIYSTGKLKWATTGISILLEQVRCTSLLLQHWV